MDLAHVHQRLCATGSRAVNAFRCAWGFASRATAGGGAEAIRERDIAGLCELLSARGGGGALDLPGLPATASRRARFYDRRLEEGDDADAAATRPRVVCAVPAREGCAYLSCSRRRRAGRHQLRFPPSRAARQLLVATAVRRGATSSAARVLERARRAAVRTSSAARVTTDRALPMSEQVRGRPISRSRRCVCMGPHGD